jgi:hypothetical protein
VLATSGSDVGPCELVATSLGFRFGGTYAYGRGDRQNLVCLWQVLGRVVYFKKLSLWLVGWLGGRMGV